MYSLLAYIIQVNILLAIVYTGYYVLLRKLTFYQLNRGYFLMGVVFSFVYPFLDINFLFRQHIEPIGEWMAYLPDFYTQQVEKSVYTLENGIYICIGVVGFWFGTRLCMQLLSLLRIHLHSKKAIWETYWYQNVLFPIVPFSFLNKIYLHKEQHQEPELYNIFEHEDIHVKGLHSMDILMFEVLLIVCWYNPFVWLVRRAVRQNLEYLTDQQVLNKGMDRQTYQYSLLQVSKQGVSLGVSSHFNFKFLKKRIMMMNKKKSSKLELSKYAFLLPIVIFSAGAFTISKADSKITEVADVVKEKQLDGVTATQETKRTLTDDVVDTVKIAGQREENTPLEEKVLVVGQKTDPSDTMKVPQGEVKMLKSKSEIDQTRDYLYLYDRKVLSKDDFFRIDDSELNGMILTSNDNFKVQYAEQRDKEGVIVAYSKEEQERQREQREKALYVIDGVIQDGKESLEVLDPDQIESIEVLKDGPATTAYGEKGKNGVILITTKK